VAAHVRDHVRGRHTTEPAHMPKAHQRHLEWTPSRLIDWARTLSPQTATLVEAILADRPAPRAGLPLLSRHPPPRQALRAARLEAACARAVAVGARSYRHVDAILKHGLDHLGPPAAAPPPRLPVHEHLRGPAYYQDLDAAGRPA